MSIPKLQPLKNRSGSLLASARDFNVDAFRQPSGKLKKNIGDSIAQDFQFTLANIEKREQARKRQEEEEEERRRQAERQANSLGSKARAFGEGLLQAPNILGTAYGTLLGQSQVRDSQRRSTAVSDKASEDIIRQMRDPKASADKKRQLQKALDAITGGSSAGLAERTRSLEEAGNTRKILAASGELALLAGTGGLSRLAGVTRVAPGASRGLQSGRLAQRGLTQVASLRSMTGRQIARAGGVSAAEGAGIGFTTGMQQDDPTLKSVAQSTLLGGALGGALPVGGAALSKTFGKSGAASKALPTLTETRAFQKLAKSKAGDALSAVNRKFVDNTNDIKKMFGKSVNKKTNVKVADEIEQYVTNIRQADGLAVDRRANNKAWIELQEVIGGKKQNYDDFGSFIKKKQDAINNIKLGKKAVVPKGTAQQEKAYRLLNESTKDDIRYLFNEGKITQEQYSKWIADPDYTRVQREVLENQSTQQGFAGLIKKSSVTDQKLKGSTKDAIDPFASYIDWNRRVTREVEMNKFGRYLKEQMSERGLTKKIDPTDPILDRIRKLKGESGVKDETMAVFEKGVKELYTVDPKVARQLQQVSDLELTAIADWALFPSRVLRGGATSMNVAFAVPNFVRDQMFSAVISKNALRTHNPVVFFQSLKETMLKPTLKATVGKVAKGDKVSKLWKPSKEYSEWLKRNQHIRRVDLARNLKTATRESLEEMGVKGESLIRKYENIISSTESATRYQNFLGTYRKALKDNIDPERAIAMANEQARTNSINFSNRGELSVFMKIFNPYFNAGAQGSRTLARALKQRPVSTSLKIGTTLLMPVAASTYYNFQDPERAAFYANLPQYERDNNIIMVLGGDRGYIKIPLTPGLREFANPLRNLIESEYLGDRQSFLETAKNILVDPFSPIGTTTKEVMSQAIPQAIKPAVEIGMNRDIYTGRDIIPEKLQGLPKDEQVFDSTPQVYRDIAKRLGVSPLQLRKAFTGYSAGAGEGTVTLLDLARGAETGGRSTPEQLASRFFSPNIKGSGEVQSRFYEELKPLNQSRTSLSREITKAVKARDDKKANELAREMNKKVDEQIKKFKTTYGRYEKEPEGLLEMMEKLKIPMDGNRLSAASKRSRLNQ
jgi:hypothetical protein